MAAEEDDKVALNHLVLESWFEITSFWTKLFVISDLFSPLIESNKDGGDLVPTPSNASWFTQWISLARISISFTKMTQNFDLQCAYLGWFFKSSGSIEIWKSSWVGTKLSIFCQLLSSHILSNFLLLSQFLRPLFHTTIFVVDVCTTSCCAFLRFQARQLSSSNKLYFINRQWRNGIT